MPQTFSPTNTVAQLLFINPPALGFARLVDDLSAAFRNCPDQGRHLTWDHDDVAILDIQGSRIVLGWAADLTGAHRGCLTIGVGYGPGAGVPGLAQRQATIARMMTERIAGRYPPDTVLWQETTERLDADLMDRLTESQDEGATAPIQLAMPVPADPVASPAIPVANLPGSVAVPQAAAAVHAALSDPALSEQPLSEQTRSGPTRSEATLSAPAPSATLAPSEAASTLTPTTHTPPATAARLVMRAVGASLTLARLRGQVYEVTRGRMERARDPQATLARVLGLGPRALPRPRQVPAGIGVSA